MTAGLVCVCVCACVCIPHIVYMLFNNYFILFIFLELIVIFILAYKKNNIKIVWG